jgi:excisionase family DNA binding protein
MDKRLLTVGEAAEYLSVSPKTLYNWASEKRIHHVKVNGSLRFDKKIMDELIEKNSIEPHPIY